MMHAKRSGFSLLELVLVGVACVVLAAIFYPVFVSAEKQPIGVVLDAERRPIPGAVLRFRDEAGRRIAVITADQKGRFRRWGMRDLSRSAVDGFLLAHTIRGTDNPGHYVFSPSGRQEIVFRDAAGRPVAELGVWIRATYRTWNTDTGLQNFERITDRRGVVALEPVPVSARFDVWSKGPRTVIRDVATRVERGVVRTAVTAIPSATVVGRLILSGGSPLGGYTAFATDGTNWAPRSGLVSDGVTGPQGRFRITGLPPGTYSIGVHLRRGDGFVVPLRRVTVRSGGETRVDLRASGLPPGPRGTLRSP